MDEHTAHGKIKIWHVLVGEPRTARTPCTYAEPGMCNMWKYLHGPEVRASFRHPADVHVEAH